MAGIQAGLLLRTRACILLANCLQAKLKGSEEVYVIKKVAFDGASESEADATVREAHVLSLLRVSG